jgi:UDP-N-acetylmuramyl pentapeptide phosphotransferase/UDP-N-acetylglucosamine-1-phosphate transferase
MFNIFMGIGFFSFFLTWVILFPFRDFLVHRKIIDIPNGRSSHTQPTPRGGGLVIVVISTMGIIVSWIVFPDWSLPNLLIFLVGAASIALEGWMDDLYSFPVRQRLVTQISIFIMISWGIGAWPSVVLPILGELHLGRIGVVVSFLWVMGLVNTYNFMDGIDGIVGVQAVVAGLGWALLGWIDGQLLVSSIGFLIAASSLGFLGHNWSPARVFMGDVSSAFLGYAFAVLPIMATIKNPHLFLAGILLVWPFIFDTTFTFFRRLRNGENVLSAHRSHFYQRLIIIGFSHRFVTLFYMVLALPGLILAVLWTLKIPGTTIVVSYSLILLPVMQLAFVKFWERYRFNKDLNKKWLVLMGIGGLQK